VASSRGRLIGMDPRPVEKITAFLHGQTRQTPYGINQQAIAAIENALIDIKAKALGIPVYRRITASSREMLLPGQTPGAHEPPCRARLI
jgi:galactonate dehydratase